MQCIRETLSSNPQPEALNPTFYMQNPIETGPERCKVSGLTKSRPENDGVMYGSDQVAIGSYSDSLYGRDCTFHSAPGVLGFQSITLNLEDVVATKGDLAGFYVHCQASHGYEN